MGHACGRQAALLTVAVLRPLASAGIASHLSGQPTCVILSASAQLSTTVKASGHELRQQPDTQVQVVTAICGTIFATILHKWRSKNQLVCLQESSQRSGIQVAHSRPTYKRKHMCRACVAKDVAVGYMAGGLHLSEGKGHAAGCSRQHGALQLVCLAVRYVMLPAVACRAGHHQQRPRWQKDGMAFSCLPELHDCWASQ